MQVNIEATDAELITKADVLVAHIQDLQEAALQRQSDDLSKAARLTIKDHPKVAITQLRRKWVTGYQGQMNAMVAEIGDYLASLSGGPSPTS